MGEHYHNVGTLCNDDIEVSKVFTFLAVREFNVPKRSRTFSISITFSIITFSILNYPLDNFVILFSSEYRCPHRFDVFFSPSYQSQEESAYLGTASLE